MKKIILSIVAIALLTLSCVIIFKGIKIGNFKISSIYEIKSESDKLNENLTTCLTLTNTEYPSKKDSLDTAIKKLKENKQKYDTLAKSDEQIKSLNTTQIKQYDIEFLWTTIGNYAKDNSIDLTLDLTQGTTANSYNIKFTAKGRYIGIQDFIYDLEDDDDLAFVIENFEIAPTTSETTTSTAVASKVNTVSAVNTVNTANTVTQGNATTQKTGVDYLHLTSKFSVLDIGINLD